MNEGMIRRSKSMHSAGFRDIGGMIRRHHYFEFDVISTQTISGQFSTIAGKEISVEWGDGSARNTYSGTDQAWSHDYGSAGNHTVRIFGSVVLTKFRMDAAGANIAFNIANAPAGLAYLYATGSNTLSGDIANAPAGLEFLTVGGSNTLSGDIANAPAGLAHLYATGSNTLSGDIANAPAGFAYLYAGGSNTLSGDIANAPAGLEFLRVTGSNIIADYTSLGHTWTTKPATLRITPVAPGGLSQTEIDNLLIDLDADLVWAAGNIIDLRGTNAARSAASDAAVASMVAEGATVTTNP